MSIILAGQLRHRVTVYTPSASVDAYGQRNQTLTQGATLFAEVRAAGAAEAIYGDGAAMRTLYQVRTRWRSGVNAGITPTAVLEYRDRRLQVTSIVREREEEDVMLIDAVGIE